MGNIEIINLTAHNITLIQGETSKIFESKGIARCKETKKIITYINDIPVYKIEYGEIAGLLPSKKGTIYIVSSIVAQSAKESREDLYVVTDTVRNKEGNIIGFRGLSKI